MSDDQGTHRQVEVKLHPISIGLHMAWRRAQARDNLQSCGNSYIPERGTPLMMMVIVLLDFMWKVSET